MADLQDSHMFAQQAAAMDHLPPVPLPPVQPGHHPPVQQQQEAPPPLAQQQQQVLPLVVQQQQQQQQQQQAPWPTVRQQQPSAETDDLPPHLVLPPPQLMQQQASPFEQQQAMQQAPFFGQQAMQQPLRAQAPLGEQPLPALALQHSAPLPPAGGWELPPAEQPVQPMPMRLEGAHLGLPPIRTAASAQQPPALHKQQTACTPHARGHNLRTGLLPLSHSGPAHKGGPHPAAGGLSLSRLHAYGLPFSATNGQVAAFFRC